ncbi:hypothetical protein [uncultured Chryseobacterium sp.]|nr:hypothetical protein [uncultured Chryseobacterium sp.]
MRKRNYIIIGILALIASLVIGFLLMLEGLRTMGTRTEARRLIILIS